MVMTKKIFKMVRAVAAYKSLKAAEHLGAQYNFSYWHLRTRRTYFASEPGARQLTKREILLRGLPWF